MQSAVQILLVLGIVINLIKGADLILRCHQQKWLQDKLDTLALRLDYTKPLEWYKRKTIGSKYWLLLCGLIFFAAGTVAMLIVKSHWMAVVLLPGGCALSVELTAHVAEQNRRLDKIGISVPRGVGESTEKLINWFMQSDTTAQLILKPTICALITAALSIAFERILYELVKRFPDRVMGAMTVLVVLFFIFLVSRLLRLNLLPLWQKLRFVDFLMIFMGIGAISVIMLISGLLMFTSELILKLLRGVTWRIAEYNKGAFAAIILLLTVVLGVLEAYLKSRH